MKAVQHTPGPWEADGAASPYKYHEEQRHFQIDAPTPKGADSQFPYTVADTSNRHHCISPDEDAANACLIAAAPEMLEALRGLLAVIRSVDPRAFSTYEGKPEDAQVMVDRAEAAIQKARGGQ